MEYVLDLQGFRRSSNIFVLKEAALVPVEEGAVPSVLHFQPPCKWSRLLEEEKSVNRWLELNYHGIPWRSGDLPYHHLIEIMQSSLKDAIKVYVKGLEKKRWIEEIVPGTSVCDLEDMGCYNLRQLNEGNALSCNLHILSWDPMCAAKNADALRNWLLAHRQRLPKEDPADDRDRFTRYYMYN